MLFGIPVIDFVEVVVYEGTIREKPSSKEEARQFIKGYSGGQAAVVGSVCVTNLKTGTRKVGWEQAEVYFYEIPAEIIDSLINEGVTLNVAGGLMLEHPLTLPFVEEVMGTADTVMGLSKVLLFKKPSSICFKSPFLIPTFSSRRPLPEVVDDSGRHIQIDFYSDKL